MKWAAALNGAGIAFALTGHAVAGLACWIVSIPLWRQVAR